MIFCPLWSQPRAHAPCIYVDSIRSSVAHLELLVMINFPCDADMKRAPSPSFLGKTNAHPSSKKNQTLQNFIIILMQRLTDDLTDFWVPRTSAGAEQLAVLLLGRCSLNCRGKMSSLKNFSSKTLPIKLKSFSPHLTLLWWVSIAAGRMSEIIAGWERRRCVGACWGWEGGFSCQGSSLAHIFPRQWIQSLGGTPKIREDSRKDEGGESWNQNSQQWNLTN